MSIGSKILETKAEIDTLVTRKVRHAAVSLLAKVQMRSPVDTGAFRQAWVMTENSPYHFTVVNDKPYAKVLEYGLYPKNSDTGKTVNGYSVQAPKGFARISIEEVKNEFK